MTTIKYCSLRQTRAEVVRVFYAVQKTTKIYRPMTKRVSANGIKGAPQKTKIGTLKRTCVYCECDLKFEHRQPIKSCGLALKLQ